MTRADLDDLIRDSHASLEAVDNAELHALVDAMEDMVEEGEIELPRPVTFLPEVRL